MKITGLIGAMGLALAALSIQAATARTAPVATTSPQELVTARQAGMGMSVAVLGAMKGASERGDAPKSQNFAARGLVKWATALPTLFPDSTKTLSGNRAKPEIWANGSDFVTKAAAFSAAANSVLAAAQADDKAAFAAALVTTAGACKACHDVYQVPPPARPAG